MRCKYCNKNKTCDCKGPGTRMTFNGRLMQDMLDERITELEETLGKLYEWRLVIDDITFYQCEKKGHGPYGIHAFDQNRCKMCKRLEER